MRETQTYKNLKGKPTNNYPVTVFVHHSGGTDANPLADTSEHTAKGMELWHIGKGWDGLGYHYVIHKNGDVWKGRPEHRNGAHAKGYNTKSIGVCLAGNFDATLPTPAQIEALREVLKDINSRLGIEDIRPHRNVANKTCYGKRLGDSWAYDLLKGNEEVMIEDVHECEDCSNVREALKESKKTVMLLISIIKKIMNIK